VSWQVNASVTFVIVLIIKVCASYSPSKESGQRFLNPNQLQGVKSKQRHNHTKPAQDIHTWRTDWKRTW